MSTYLLLKFVHLLAFVYWLGGDLGTFLASRQVVNSSNSPEARSVALKIMLACDMGPKLAMPIILPLGMQLAGMTGMATLPDWGMPLLWLVTAVWFAMVAVLYFREGQPIAARLAPIDLGFRIVVALALLAWGVAELTGSHALAADWLAIKVIIFALMVACGIGIRLNLKPFGPAFASMLTEGQSPASDQAMQQSIARCRPFVWAIWAGLFINAALGLHLIG